MEIVFHEGLNTIVRDDVTFNLLGKSTILMIIYFVFRVDDHVSKNCDAGTL
ncbi:hypothetical protein SD457_22150 [Coprobacillaceae bacterium CR2/5/TPMF4]|nr:hypothetical protein SD457_22150 [Coprobacillaceae bacterium CR2/5/TPMF4]